MSEDDNKQARRRSSLRLLVKAALPALALAVVVLLLSVSGEEASATQFCGRPYAELTQDPGQPYNAVGFLNNGCTAFLIDPNHIAAAAHCFVGNTVTGAWQTNLRFYPNFHPDRVAADARHVPRADVTRVVVGSRTAEAVLGSGMDWAIARVDNWRDTGGLDLTPIALAPFLPPAGTPLSNPAYTRHHFPYNDNDAITWDNMQWDNTFCGFVKPNNGMWAIQMRTAPLFDGVNPDTTGCNSRWGAGMIHYGCSLTRVQDDLVIHSCDTIGGSSGSPIIYRPRIGLLKTPSYVIALGGGSNPYNPSTAASNNFGLLAPTCAPDTPQNRQNENVAVSVERFRNAPRFASNVAVHRRPDNPSATAVFAVDSDLNQVAYRYRTGSNPQYTGEFSFWRSLGTPYPGAKLTRIAACSADAFDRPQVFVIADKMIYTRKALSGETWGPWLKFDAPGAGADVIDLDASTDASNRCRLFAIAEGGNLYTRSQNADAYGWHWWGSWHKAASGTYTKVTALNYGGVAWAAMVDSAGEVWRASLTPSGSASPTRLTRPAGVKFRDIDMTWDEAGRGFMVAVPLNSGNRLYFMPMYGSGAWTQWRSFETRLWAPGASAPQNAPNLQSVTASRWMEDPAGVTSPAIFATDDFGNVYFIEYTRVGSPRWILDWKSFYHESIAY